MAIRKLRPKPPPGDADDWQGVPAEAIRKAEASVSFKKLTHVDAVLCALSWEGGAGRHCHHIGHLGRGGRVSLLDWL